VPGLSGHSDLTVGSRRIQYFFQEGTPEIAILTEQAQKKRIRILFVHTWYLRILDAHTRRELATKPFGDSPHKTALRIFVIIALST